MPIPNFDIDKVIARQRQARRQKTQKIIRAVIIAALALLIVFILLRGG
ncbi:MAG: hypothetical protein HRF47_10140 [Chloroflexota bacterium]|jgi:hypothetical protein